MGLSVTLAILLARRSTSSPQAPEHRAEQRSPSEQVNSSPSINTSQSRLGADFVQRDIERPPEANQPPVATTAARYTVDESRRELLWKLAGMRVTPMLGLPADGRTYTAQEVAELYPFLRLEDGMVDVPAVQRVRDILNERNRLRWDHAERLRNLRNDTNAYVKVESTAPPEVRTLTEDLMGIVHAYEQMLALISPTPEMESISGHYTRMNVPQWRAWLRMLAEIQTRAEGGYSTEKSIEMIKRLPPSPRHSLSDEQALWLLKTPLDQMVQAQYLTQRADLRH